MLKRLLNTAFWRHPPMPPDPPIPSSYRDAYFSGQRRLKSDKWEHYFDIYDHVMGHRYGSPCVYLEIGVQGGGSLEVARHLFGAGATIIGIDIDPTCSRFQDSRLANRVFIGSQVDPGLLAQVKAFAPTIDVVIDDGSHVQSHMIQTFIELFPHVSQGGTYVIEDTHTNFSVHHQASFHGIGLYDYFKGLSERLNLEFLDPAWRQGYKVAREGRPQRPAVDPFLQDIFSIEFFDSVIAVRKQRRLAPLRHSFPVPA
jgi:Methyltransferase domain